MHAMVEVQNILQWLSMMLACGNFQCRGSLYAVLKLNTLSSFHCDMHKDGVYYYKRLIKVSELWPYTTHVCRARDDHVTSESAEPAYLNISHDC